MKLTALFIQAGKFECLGIKSLALNPCISKLDDNNCIAEEEMVFSIQRINPNSHEFGMKRWLRILFLICFGFLLC